MVVERWTKKSKTHSRIKTWPYRITGWRHTNTVCGRQHAMAKAYYEGAHWSMAWSMARNEENNNDRARGVKMKYSEMVGGSEGEDANYHNEITKTNGTETRRMKIRRDRISRLKRRENKNRRWQRYIDASSNVHIYWCRQPEWTDKNILFHSYTKLQVQ